MILQKSRLAYGAVIAAAVLWGGSIVAQKLALSGFSAVEASVLRDIGGLAILLITWWWQEGTLAKLTKADVRMLGLLGLGVLGNHLLILMGLKYVSGAVGGVIIGSSPVVTALLSAVLIQDVPLRAVWAGGLLSFAGVGLVSVAGFQAAGDQPLLGADANGFYVSTNEFPITGSPSTFNGAQVYAMSKQALVDGNLPAVLHINAGAIQVPPQDQVNGGIWYSIQPATSPAAAVGPPTARRRGFTFATEV